VESDERRPATRHEKFIIGCGGLFGISFAAMTALAFGLLTPPEWWGIGRVVAGLVSGGGGFCLGACIGERIIHSAFRIW